MRRLAVCLLICFGAQSGQAASYPPLNPVQSRELGRAIANEMRPGTIEGRLYGLDGLPPRPAVLELFVKEIADNLEKPAPIYEGRLKIVLARMAGIATSMKDKTEIRAVRPEIESALDRILARVSGPSEAQRSLLTAYMHLGLVTPRLLWFFERIKTKEELTEAAPALIRVLELGNEDERARVADLLRGLSKNSLLSYALLAKTGMMTEGELVKFFKYASIKFASAVADTSKDDLEFSIEILEDRRHRLVRDQIEAFSLALARENEHVRSAFTKAVTKAKEAKAEGYDPKHRLLFFKLFQERKVAWDDRSTWREMAHTAPAPRFRAYPLLPDTVRLEEFRAEAACNDNL